LCVAISNGVRDEKLHEKLWQEDLALDKIIEKCNLWQQREQTRHLYSEDLAATTVVKVAAEVKVVRVQVKELMNSMVPLRDMREIKVQIIIMPTQEVEVKVVMVPPREVKVTDMVITITRTM
jgi:hypothetical protein